MMNNRHILEIIKTARKSENDEEVTKQELNEETRYHQAYCKTSEGRTIAAMQNEQELIKEAVNNTSEIEAWKQRHAEITDLTDRLTNELRQAESSSIKSVSEAAKLQIELTELQREHST